MKGVEAGEIGAKAASELCQELSHGGCLDFYLQDQVKVLIIIWVF